MQEVLVKITQYIIRNMTIMLCKYFLNIIYIIYVCVCVCVCVYSLYYLYYYFYILYSLYTYIYARKLSLKTCFFSSNRIMICMYTRYVYLMDTL